jgi:hypothetical protein
MSGLLGRLADLAGRSLAGARAQPPARPGGEQTVVDARPEDERKTADAHPDASSAPAWALARPRQASDPGDEAAHIRAPAASERGAREAVSRKTSGEERPMAPAPGSTVQPTDGGPTWPTAEANAPTNEAGAAETDVRIEAPEPPKADAGPSLPSRDRTARPLERAPDPALLSSTEENQTQAGARPGLLRDVEVRVVSPLNAALGAPIRPRPGDPPPELQERWRELGARLRSTHPPTGSGAEPGEVRKRQTAWLELAAPPLVPHAHRQAQLATNQRETAPPRPELIIRHLEIRIVAAANEAAPAAESRPPDRLAGAWQSAARRYLRL